MSELLPCPFCGGEAEAVHEINGMWTVECIECGALVDGIGAWNTRAEQTCRIDPIVKQVNGAEWTGFKCDTCLYWEVSPFAGLASAIGRFNYCPNCGAKVTPKCSETTPKVVGE